MSATALAALPLPPVELRAGGHHFASDDAFLAGAVRDVRKLVEFTKLTPESTLLDWGCGSGRLAVGIKAEAGSIRSYLGVDVRAEAISWARQHLGDDHFRFVRIDALNRRYNPAGRSRGLIPAPDTSIDVVYAYSVLSHMEPAEARHYLHEVSRVLRPAGRALLTAFVEDDCPAFTENPDDYGPIRWHGALHCARFSRSFFIELLNQSGLSVGEMVPGQETDGQSLYVVSPTP